MNKPTLRDQLRDLSHDHEDTRHIRIPTYLWGDLCDQAREGGWTPQQFVVGAVVDRLLSERKRPQIHRSALQTAMAMAKATLDLAIGPEHKQA